MEQRQALAGFALSGALFVLALSPSPLSRRAVSQSHRVRRLSSSIRRPFVARRSADAIPGGDPWTGSEALRTPDRAELRGRANARNPGRASAACARDESWRSASRRPFERVDDLLRVRGIGPKTLENLRLVVAANRLKRRSGSVDSSECRFGRCARIPVGRRRANLKDPDREAQQIRRFLKEGAVVRRTGLALGRRARGQSAPIRDHDRRGLRSGSPAASRECAHLLHGDLADSGDCDRGFHRRAIGIEAISPAGWSRNSRRGRPGSRRASFRRSGRGLQGAGRNRRAQSCIRSDRTRAEQCGRRLQLDLGRQETPELGPAFSRLSGHPRGRSAAWPPGLSLATGLKSEWLVQRLLEYEVFSLRLRDGTEAVCPG